MRRTKMDKWDNRFIKLAEHVAGWSKDVHGVGSVIVDGNHIVLSMGYNGFPRGADDDREIRKVRSHKLIYTIHAEENAILNAARNGVSLNNTTIYLQWFPCVDCAKRIINAGIKRVVCKPYDPKDEMRMRDYKFDLSYDLLKECNIQIDFYETDKTEF
jgi:dCMP deaminase